MKTETFIKKCLRHIKNIYKPETQIDMYRRMGVVIGENCYIISSSIDCTLPEIIQIGNNVTITHATILAHDASTKRSLGYTKVGRVLIGNNVFIGWDSMIMPNVIIGDNCIVGAKALVNKNVPSNSVVAGNPAEVICSFDEYIEKNATRLDSTYKCDSFPNDIRDCRRNMLINSVIQSGGGYIR